MPTWKAAIEVAVQAENWPARHGLLSAALDIGADPNLVTHWRRFDFARFVRLATLSGHTHYVWGVAWSPDGSRLATSSYDQTAKIWEAASGRALLTLSGHTNYVRGMAWSPDGTRLATASADKTAIIWGEE